MGFKTAFFTLTKVNMLHPFLPAQYSAQFIGRHERILKIAMKVLVVLGVIYGVMACLGGVGGSGGAEEDGEKVRIK